MSGWGPRRKIRSMKEMLLVGRGGEGVVLASQILAETFARAGYWVQSFPEFTAERRGAPISASLRWDERSPIHRRFKVQDCDVLVVVSPSPPPPQVVRRVRPGGLVILNRESRFCRCCRARGRAGSGVADRAGERDPLVGGPADRQRRRSRRLREAPAPGRARVPRAGGPVTHRPAGRGEHRRRESGLRALHEAAQARRRRAPRARSTAAGAPQGRSTACLSRQHDGLACEPHGHLVARPAPDRRRMHCLRGLRALLSRGRDHESRRRDRGRLSVLQGLRHLRGRLPGPRRVAMEAVEA